uniref:NADP-dependent oxidoreductase domain-containing protein n=1 Tax=Equus asinus TaxID=9793 RepID=A0A8C4PT61_EQUAS
MDPKCWRVELNDGRFIPVLGFGTYAPEEVPKSMAGAATKVAIDVGFRHIDSAYLYQNEEEVGKALREKIRDGTVKREDIFYTTKLWATFLRPELVRPALERSLKKLGLDYVDLFIIHVPIAMKPGEELVPKDAGGKIILDTVDFCDTWEALEKCKDAGLTKSIGVSNFNHKQLEMILNKPRLKYKPVCNQVECHPYLNQRKLLEFCKSQDIVLVAYSALGSHRDPNWVERDSPYLLEDPILNAIAKKHNRSPGQIALRYQLQRGVVVLAKSFNEKRIQENFQRGEFTGRAHSSMKMMSPLRRGTFKNLVPLLHLFYLMNTYLFLTLN